MLFDVVLDSGYGKVWLGWRSWRYEVIRGCFFSLIYYDVLEPYV